MMGALTQYRLLWPPLAGALILLGERVIPGGTAGAGLTTLGVAGLVLLLVWELAAPRMKSVRGEVPPNRWGVWPRAVFVLAAALYLAGKPLTGAEPGAVDWAALLDWSWVLALLAGGPVFLLVEVAWRAQRHNPARDPVRLARATHAGAILGLLLALVVTLNFVFHQLGWESDLAYFKTSEPSEATVEVLAGVERLAGVDQPVEAALFFASGNRVRPLVRAYFQALAEKSGKINFREYDADTHPNQAREYKVRGNGNLVLRRANSREQISIGTTLERARAKLKKMDQSVLTGLLKVTRREQVAYFTVGHGEFNENSSGNTSAIHRYNRFQTLLRANNFKVKPLGMAEGLGKTIPGDAGLVVILGPKRGFLPGAVAALKAYVEAGGRMMVFLESTLPTAVGTPEREPKGTGLRAFLESFGIVHNPAVLAHDRIFARRTFSRADHVLLVTVGYQDHASTRNLRRQSKENALLLLGSGQFEQAKAPPGYRLSPLLKGMPGTWADTNGNFVFDGDKEKRGQPLLAQGLSALGTGGAKPSPRILAFADADLALDFLMQNQANQKFITGALSWLVADGRPTGVGKTEEDRKIIHADSDQLIWFYLPVFGVPLAVAGFGYWITARAARRRGEVA